MTASDVPTARGLLLHANADEALVFEALAELDRLVARVEQLEQMHREQEKRANRAEARLRDAAPLGGDGSHWDGCWRSHIDCAVARVEQAERERSVATDWAAELALGKQQAERERDEAREWFGQAAKKLQAAEARVDTLTRALERIAALDLNGWAKDIAQAAFAPSAPLTSPLRAAMEHLARSDSWEIVGDAESNIEECGVMLKGPQSPWMFARAALAAADRPEGTTPPVNTSLVPAEFEQALRDRGAPVRCCGYWPECSHMLAWYEERVRPEGTTP